MTILEEIVAQKKLHIAQCQQITPHSALEQRAKNQIPPVSARQSILNTPFPAFITEFKRKSPSKGWINADADLQTVVAGYAQAGAAAISVLTDTAFFGGADQDLEQARQKVNAPLLRKDFMLDEYQILEARALGADLILLIAACLTPQVSVRLAQFAKTLGMEVLLEVHNEAELQSHLNPHVDLVGVNNRNLHTFHTSIDTSLALAERIPAEFIKVSESGLSQPESIVQLSKAGFQAFLIGENFMRATEPATACIQFKQAVESALLTIS